MSKYSQLSLEERCSIARLHEGGQSSRQIAATLDRQPSTITRELKRNTGRKIGYQPAYAQSLTAARRWTGNKLERDDALRETVLKRLTAGWSPEQIAGRLAREAGHNVISYETIYRFVYAQLKRTNGTEFYRHQQLSTLLNIQTYFCDPHAPWQKGSVENAIGRLRRALPRKTDIANLPKTRFNAIIANYNNTPRKCLRFQTPAEASIQPLHFECEPKPVSSTGRRGWGWQNLYFNADVM